jgi:hypothetical protein
MFEGFLFDFINQQVDISVVCSEVVIEFIFDNRVLITYNIFRTF